MFDISTLCQTTGESKARYNTSTSSWLCYTRHMFRPMYIGGVYVCVCGEGGQIYV